MFVIFGILRILKTRRDYFAVAQSVTKLCRVKKCIME